MVYRSWMYTVGSVPQPRRHTVSHPRQPEGVRGRVQRSAARVDSGYRDPDQGPGISPDKGDCGERDSLQEEGRDPSPLTSWQGHDVDGPGVPLGKYHLRGLQVPAGKDRIAV